VIALDTNVLVRFLVEDDPAQCRRARALLERAIDAGAPCFVPEVVVCEVVWVLEASYKVRREEIVRVLDQLLRAQHLAFSSSERLWRAARAFEAGRGDFADYLIREWAWEGGCELVATFDRDLLKEPGFTAP
jgi:predicted nucleic-acid-binding protein